MDAIQNAGRQRTYKDVTCYTTLSPCMMCTGTIIQFGIPRVVVADVVNASSDETIRFLKDRGVEVIVLDPMLATGGSAVVGDGAVGLLGILAAKQLGAERIIAFIAVILPLGVMEYHGEHLSVGMDTLAVTRALNVEPTSAACTT